MKLTYHIGAVEHHVSLTKNHEITLLDRGTLSTFHINSYILDHLSVT